MGNVLYKLWRKLLPFVFIFILVHFLKDITQDILKIPTPLDYLGDVKEDLSSFPVLFQNIFMLFGVASFIAEAFLLVAIPVAIIRREITSLDRIIFLTFLALVAFFLLATLLDPRFSLLRG